MESAVSKRQTPRSETGAWYLRLTELSRTTWLLLGLTAAGGLLRLYLLGDKSIWLDEAFSIALGRHGLGELLALVEQTDTHPPLYYAALKLWMALGESEAHVRLLSALLSTAAIPLMHLVAQTLYEDANAGLLGAGILALSPFQVWFAQEARMYAMLTFFVLASSYFFLRALRQGTRRAWVGYVLTTAAALYTDNGALWYVASTGLFMVLTRRRFAHRMRHWLMSQGAIALLYLPWLPSLWRQTQQVTESFWLPPPSFQSVLGALLDFQSYNFPFLPLAVLYLTVIFVWTYIVPGGGWQRRLATAWLFVPLLISLLLSLRQPIFLSRNLIAASLGFYLLITGTVCRFQSPRATAILILPLLAMNLVATGHNAWREEKPDWRSLAAHVAQTAGTDSDGLVVFIPGYAELPFSYYFQQHDLRLDTQGYPADELLLHAQPQEVDDIATMLEGQERVWLVLRDVETVDPDWQVKIWLDSNGYERGPDFEGEEIAALTYTRWDVTQDNPLPATETETTTPGEAEAEAPAVAPEGERGLFLPLLTRQEPQPQPTPPPATIHVIQPGDNLWTLARRYGTTVQALMEANDISNTTRLRVGQELLIP
jgi:hypothetical protein